MPPVTTQQERVNDIWARAAAQLSDDEKRTINFSRSDKRKILAELHAEVEKSRQKSLESRWRYTRKSGEIVIIRDVFDKMVRWIDMAKQIGDVAVQYDPVHASLPWAGIRLVLQIAVNDTKKFASVIEGLVHIAQLICRYAIIEALYLHGETDPAKELKKAVVRLYASILSYLSMAKQYLEQSTTKRVLRSAISDGTQLESGLSNIRTAEHEAGRCMVLVDRSDQRELVRLLESINTPMRRMNDDLKALQSQRVEILQWLSPEPYIKHHRQARQGVLAGTGQWLLSDPLFKKWKDESASSVLWLHGIPGSGKSKLVSIVIEDALKSFEAGNTPQPVFFYCSRNPAEPTRSNPEAVLASLARQLSCIEPKKPLMKPTVDLFEEKEEEGFASGPPELDDSRALILQLIELYPLTTIVIDAMDECNPQKRRELLGVLEEILQNASGLVKMFISSRNDQDIVLRLKNYPNLEIDSRKNSDDIARFVKHQVRELIKNGELLQYSTLPADMEELITWEVIEGADGMFRWASMQLQYICQFDVDGDVRKNLGRLPPDLNTLYAEIYDFLSKRPGEIKATLFKNALRWLLCAQRRLRADEFLCAISMNVQSQDPTVLVSKELVLKICNNFVVFDSQLDTFRFAHLSVREFLEQRPDYSSSNTNALAAEICLWTVLSTNKNSVADRSLLSQGLPKNITPSVTGNFCEYADIYWPVHCQAAGESRKSGAFNMAFTHVMSYCLGDWHHRLKKVRGDPGYSDDWEAMKKLQYAIPATNNTIAARLLVCCIFGFEEELRDILQDPEQITSWVNEKGLGFLEVAARYGSCAVIGYILERDQPCIEITEEVVKSAAYNSGNAKEIIELLLDRRGDDVQITTEVVDRVLENFHQHEIMKLLLDRRGGNVQITSKTVSYIARWFDTDILALLLDRWGDSVQIADEVIEAVIQDGDRAALLLLLDRRGDSIQITEENMARIAEYFDAEVITLLLDRLGENVQITEKIMKAAARNDDYGDKIMTLFFNQRENDILTEEVVRAAAPRVNSEVLKVFFERNPSLPITEEVIKAVAENENGEEIMTLLLDRLEDNFQITENTVAHVTEYANVEVTILLLDRLKQDIQITEEVVKAAASSHLGKEKIRFLLERDPSLLITEEVVKVAVSNLFGEENIGFLLETDPSLLITEEVVKVAASNPWYGKEIVTLLLDRRGDDIQITEEIVKAAVCNRDGEVVIEVLLRRYPSLLITEEVLIKAARSTCGKKSIRFLLERDPSLLITEEIVKAAASNSRSGKEIVTLLLDQRGDNIQITEEIIKTAACNLRGRAVIEVLHARYPPLPITKEVLIAAMHNSDGDAVLEFLLQNYPSESVNEEVVKAAVQERRDPLFWMGLKPEAKQRHLSRGRLCLPRSRLLRG
ncbi:MAG: hypothetical protein M1821_007708 [Bathelium mastoideum]|nr:MAG: hypothetical protein M1821_007708 [Bathelium mastoideum]